MKFVTPIDYRLSVSIVAISAKVLIKVHSYLRESLRKLPDLMFKSRRDPRVQTGEVLQRRQRLFKYQSSVRNFSTAWLSACLHLYNSVFTQFSKFFDGAIGIEG
jgi:hypothetical protein